MRDFIDIVESKLTLFEMASLPPHETGLGFPVWVSPRGRAKHSARIKVTNPPYGANIETIYQIEPFGWIKGKKWLTTEQEQKLEQWINLNKQPLINFWNGQIHYESDLKSLLVAIDDAPPGNYRETIAALRIIAPKVSKIYWHGGYDLYFQKYAPELDKIISRAQDAEINQTITINIINGEDTSPLGILLWPRPNVR